MCDFARYRGPARSVIRSAERGRAMKSCIYEGTIRHRRFAPVINQFQYPIFLVYLDLSELDRAFDAHPRWSNERFNIATFRRCDHVGDPRMPLDKAVREVVERKTGDRPGGPIRILTHLRYFGYCFNPVSFYYCFDADDREVTHIVAEVHNTPWLETHCYVFSVAANEHPAREWRRYRFAKAFHVSPFMDMDIAYDWRFRVPGERIAVHMINHHRGEKLFDASLSLHRRAMDRRTMSRVLRAYPLMTAKVIAAIHWQALRLWWKGAPYFTHPKNRPIDSLSGAEP